jgi:hypothetical protein
LFVTLLVNAPPATTKCRDREKKAPEYLGTLSVKSVKKVSKTYGTAPSPRKIDCDVISPSL